MQEHVLDFSPPEKFRGHKCAIRMELRCDTGSHKCGWHFEGFTISFNNESNMKKNDFFEHSETVNLD